MGITVFISLWTTRLILNSLGVADFGIFNVVGGAITMLGFLNSTLASSTQRFINHAEGENNFLRICQVFNASIVLHFIVALLAGIILYVAAFFFFNGILNISPDRIVAAKTVYGCMIVSTMFSVMSAPYHGLVNAHENMKYYAFIGVLESLLKLAVAFMTMYTLKDKLIVYGILMAIIPFITLSILRFYCHKNYQECKLAVKRYWNKDVYKEVLSFAGWKLFPAVTSLLGVYGMNLVLNHFFGAALNAAQGVAGQLNGQLMAFTTNMQKAVNPVVTKKEGSGDRQKMLEISTSTSKVSFYLLSILAIPFIVEAPYIMKIWLKNVPDYAVVFTQLQLLRTLLEQMTAVYGVSLAAEGHIAKFSAWNSVIWLMPLFFSTIAYMHGGSPQWMYYMNIIFFGIAFTFVKMYFMKKNCGLPYRAFIGKLIVPLTLSSGLHLTFTYIPSIFMQESFLRLISTLLISTLAFIVTAWLFGFSQQERKTLQELARKGFAAVAGSIHKA